MNEENPDFIQLWWKTRYLILFLLRHTLVAPPTVTFHCNCCCIALHMHFWFHFIVKSAWSGHSVARWFSHSKNLHTPAEKGDATLYNLRRSFVFSFLSDLVWKKEVLGKISAFEIYIKKTKINHTFRMPVKHWDTFKLKCLTIWCFLNPFHYENQYGNYDVKNFSREVAVQLRNTQWVVLPLYLLTAPAAAAPGQSKQGRFWCYEHSDLVWLAVILKMCTVNSKC